MTFENDLAIHHITLCLSLQHLNHRWFLAQFVFFRRTQCLVLIRQDKTGSDCKMHTSLMRTSTTGSGISLAVQRATRMNSPRFYQEKCNFQTLVSALTFHRSRYTAIAGVSGRQRVYRIFNNVPFLLSQRTIFIANFFLQLALLRRKSFI